MSSAVAGVGLVPEGDFGLTQFVAQADVPTIMLGGKIDQAHEIIFENRPELGEFANVTVHAELAGVHFLEHSRQLAFLISVQLAAGLQLDQALVGLLQFERQFGDVAEDTSQQGDAGVGLVHGEELFVSKRGQGHGGVHLRNVYWAGPAGAGVGVGAGGLGAAAGFGGGGGSGGFVHTGSVVIFEAATAVGFRFA